MTEFRHEDGLLPSIAKDINDIRKLASDDIRNGRSGNAITIRNLTLELDMKMDRLVMDMNKALVQAARTWDK